MTKRIRPNRVSQFKYGSDYGWGSFTLTEGQEEYVVQMQTVHLQQFSAAISELAMMLTDKMDAIQGSGIVAPRPVTKAEALPGADQSNVVLLLTTSTGQVLQLALPLDASRDLRSMMEDAESFTSGGLGQTKQ